jgi:tetratricopeptide (TPR) repeat protein
VKRLPLLLAGLALSCGYFNSMYNAQRRFGDAERAARAGNNVEAARAYAESIERAASSYRGHPRGRWADDALLLIGRARFALGEYDAAVAAFQTLLEMPPDPELRTATLAWMGAAELQSGLAAAAEARLDDVLAADPQEGLRSFARLWRARARFRNGNVQAAWADLDAVAAAGNDRSAAALEGAGRAIEFGDSARFRHAVAALSAASDGARWSDTLATFVTDARARFGPAITLSTLEAVDRGPWPAAAREPHTIMRIELLAEAGDTTQAITQAVRFAERASPASAGRVRVLAARLELASVDSVPDLARVRALLLPVLDHADARALIRSVKVIEVLLERAAEGQPLALFAAAELARDELHAFALARQLFLAYAEIVPDAVWAPKALLAAAALASSGTELDAIATRLHAHADNVYARAVQGSTDEEMFRTAEERLARSLVAIREDALVTADSRDVRVGTAIARLDSLKAAALADSVRLACGEMIDSLAIRGIRADSVRSACIRRDAARIRILLEIDTLLLRDTTRADSLAGRRRGGGPALSETRLP